MVVLFYVLKFDVAHRLIVVAGPPLLVLTDDAVREQKHVLLNLRLVDLGPEALQPLLVEPQSFGRIEHRLCCLSISVPRLEVFL